MALKRIMPLLYLFAVVTSCSCDSEEDLARTLLNRMNLMREVKALRSTAMKVNMTLAPMFILGLEETTQTFLTSIYFNMYWHDRRLAWNSSHYGGIENIFIRQDRTWLPDIVIENVAETSSIFLPSDFAILLLSKEGRVNWAPGGTLKTVCKVDVILFPFDTQKCDITVGTWMSDIKELRLGFLNPAVDFVSFLNSTEWDLLQVVPILTTRSFPEKDENDYFDQITFTFHMRRRSTFYVVKILLPVLLLALMNSMVFLVPAGSGERVSMSVTTMLSLTVFLGYIGGITPANSYKVPIIAIYVLLNLVIGAVSTFCNIIVLNKHFYLKDGKKKTAPKNKVCPMECDKEVQNQQGDAIDEDSSDGLKTSLCSNPLPAFCFLNMNDLDKAFFAIILVTTVVGTVWCFIAMLQ